ncbi:MAG: iron chaperone, partial [Ktedonobacterales bacterium]
MDTQKAGYRTIDEYIATFPEDIQAKLQTVRATIRAAAPDAEECISYAMPAFTQDGNLVYFA